MQNKSFFLTFSSLKDLLAKIYLTLFFSGLSPKAPGTIGTLVAIPFAYFIASFSHTTLFLLALLVSALGIKIIDHYEKEGLKHDSKEIVIDELAGVWVSIAMVGNTTFGIILSFIFFRIFDIWKPSIIGKVDKTIKGGLGVMGDDLLAGFFAGLLGLIIIGLLENFT
ncbi:phosphatidylglycerophosphatase A family protein [Helicobacter mesocricetorum]|uniref:phosphatidylglycerophosphatase A family protein n=1 Tax=Helicobacter mesocricetorum TaxID=87012 RepID=UPI000CF053B4|nr:phosphatidylglycerophosphatase A [Helicobacter mesocricetorum]